MDSPTLEYIVKQKNEGEIIIKKLGFLCALLLLFISLLALILNLAAPTFFIPFVLLDVALCAMIFFAVWRFFCVEYEIVFGGGEINLTVIYGRSTRKRLTTIQVNSLIEVGIYDNDAYEKLCRASLKKNYICVSSMAAPVMYYALFDEGKERCIIYFEADERAIKYLKMNNSSALRAGNIK